MVIDLREYRKVRFNVHQGRNCQSSSKSDPHFGNQAETGHASYIHQPPNHLRCIFESSAPTERMPSGNRILFGTPFSVQIIKAVQHLPHSQITIE